MEEFDDVPVDTSTDVEPAPNDDSSDSGADLRSALEKIYDELETGSTDDDEQVSDEEVKPEGEEVPQEPATTDEPAPVPDDVREYIGTLEVERDISYQFKEALSPHFDFIQEYNINPYQHISELMGVSRTLATGSAEDKAGMIANLCDMFKVDLEQLDNALYEISQRPAPSTEEKLLQKLEALEQKIEQKSTPRNEPAPAVNTSELEAEIRDFASKNEFFKEVQSDMAIFLNSGKANNLEEAYKLAIKLNDGVQKTLRERQQKTQQSVQAAKTGLKQSSAPVKVKKGPVSLREALEAAFDENE